MNQKSVMICLNACKATNLKVAAVFEVDGAYQYVNNEIIPVPTAQSEGLLWLELSIITSENSANSTVKGSSFASTNFTEIIDNASIFKNWVIRDQDRQTNIPFFVINSTEQCQRTTTTMPPKLQYTTKGAPEIAGEVADPTPSISSSSSSLYDQRFMVAGVAVGVVLFGVVFVAVGALFYKRRIKARGNARPNNHSKDAVVGNSNDGFKAAIIRRESINSLYQTSEPVKPLERHVSINSLYQPQVDVDASSSAATRYNSNFGLNAMGRYPVNHCSVNSLYQKSEYEQGYGNHESVNSLYHSGNGGYVRTSSTMNDPTKVACRLGIGNSHASENNLHSSFQESNEESPYCN
ncbi:uncharacterized protein LOC108672596 [Hyalella azteca]|uniref:Uncharacterized protein LOC108672596 n=1 Tax=Hyalella azteca TaxID=294128 RepID=A0A8B7NQ27_HYAAZ|nr:uncharacterized protein LOC108672596 [Hyalella azteca]